MSLPLTPLSSVECFTLNIRLFPLRMQGTVPIPEHGKRCSPSSHPIAAANPAPPADLIASAPKNETPKSPPQRQDTGIPRPWPVSARGDKVLYGRNGAISRHFERDPIAYAHLEAVLGCTFIRAAAKATLQANAIDADCRPSALVGQNELIVLREDCWLIVAPLRSNDETSEQAHTGER
jgi:hypothetical protein